MTSVPDELFTFVSTRIINGTHIIQNSLQDLVSWRSKLWLSMSLFATCGISYLYDTNLSMCIGVIGIASVSAYYYTTRPITLRKFWESLSDDEKKRFVGYFYACVSQGYCRRTMEEISALTEYETRNVICIVCRQYNYDIVD